MRYIVQNVTIPRYESGRESWDYTGRIVAVLGNVDHQASATKMDVLIELPDR